MSINVNDLSVAIMLLEKDFGEVRQEFKDLKLKDFDDQLKCRCSGVFQNQLIEVKKLIEFGKLSVIKENFKSCAVPLNLMENSCELGFVKERAEEVNTLVRQKLDKLGGRIEACDKSLTALCSLIDFHIETYAIKGRLENLLSIDPTGMNQTKLDQVNSELKELEQNYKWWSEPRSKSLRKHSSDCHGLDKGNFVQAVSDMRLKCNQRKDELQREKFLGDVEFVLDGLRDGRTGNLQQRFADFPADVQWKIFTCAGMVKGELPTTPALIFDCLTSAGRAIPQSLAKTVDATEESLLFTLQEQASVLFLCPETAFVACVDALEGCVKEKYLKDADAVQKKLQGSARFGLLKELIKLNVKSQDPKANIRRLLEEAEGKGLNVQGNKGVYFWVWFYAHQVDSSAGGPGFGKKNAHKDLDRLFLAIDEASITPELLLQRYDSTRISSLDRLKTELEKIKEHSLSGEQREGIVRAILSSAARGGVVLDLPNGVFYWVWKLASDNGEPTHGGNWGGDNAPKNIDRLIAAINLAG